MRPRTIVIIAVAAIIVIGIGAGIIFYFAQTGGAPAAATGTGGAGGGSEVTLPASQALDGSPTPTGATFTIGTPHGVVTVNNFYLTNPPVTDGGETVIVASTTDYLITYNTTDSSFWIGVDAAQFSAVRPVAEQALLSTLGVNAGAACKLAVAVGVFYDASSTLSGQSFPLSFCTSLPPAQ